MPLAATATCKVEAAHGNLSADQLRVRATACFRLAAKLDHENNFEGSKREEQAGLFLMELARRRDACAVRRAL
jgi:hypothetical protein